MIFFSVNKLFLKCSTSNSNSFLIILFTNFFHVNPTGNLISDDITAYREKGWKISSPVAVIILKNIVYFPKLE